MKQVDVKISLGLSNRDGEILLVRDTEGECYLVAEADTCGNEEFFEGLGSTEHVILSEPVFDILSAYFW